MSAQTGLISGRVGGLCLAAGQSQRMGEGTNKLILPIDGIPLVCWPVDAMRDAGLGPLRVVTGFESRRVEQELAVRECVFYEHADWESGMGSSLAFGARQMMSEVVRGEATWEAMLVCLGDLPGLRSATVEKVLGAASPDRIEEQIVIPTFKGRRGHPVLFGRKYWSALARLSGDRGAKAIAESAGDHLVEVEVETKAIFADLDTPEDLSDWLERDR